MKKLIVSAVIIGVFIIYALAHARASVGFTPSQGSTGSSSDPSSGSSSGSSGGSGSSSSQQGSTPTTTGQYKNGSYTGSEADAQWGNIQVKITIQNGRLTNVQFLEYPNHRDRSVEINNYAMPQLSSEAISAQSAQVDVISGATDTSEAFMQSLGDALSQAS
ncbi:MAG TPA: FMN-binding protein [Ktedonobacterales bacterium]